MTESKYWLKGGLVTIWTEKSHLPEKNVTILEVLEHGIWGTQKAIKDAPVKWYPFDKIVAEAVDPSKPEQGIRTTSGARK